MNVNSNYSMKRIGGESFYNTKYSYKALQLTPKSNKNITGNYAKGVKAVDEQKRKDALQAVYTPPAAEKQVETPVKNEVVEPVQNNIEIEVKVITDMTQNNKETLSFGRRPIRLQPKMYTPISKLYSDKLSRVLESMVKEEVEEVKAVEDVPVQPVIEDKVVESVEEVELTAPVTKKEVEIEFDYDKLSRALEEINKQRIEKEEREEVEKEEIKDTSNIVDMSEYKGDRKEQIERFLELKRLIKQQNEDREKAEKTNEELSRDEEQAEKKYSETFDRFVEYTNRLEKEANKNSELISEMIENNKKLSENIAKRNKESDELRAMFDTSYDLEEDSVIKKAA